MIHRFRVLTLVATALAAAFVALALRVGAAGAVAGEHRFLRAARGSVGHRVDEALQLVDAATDSRWLLLAAAALVGLLLRQRRPRQAALVVVAVVGAVVLNPLLKQLVDRPRPSVVALQDVSALSFPSGHAAGTAALALAVVLAAAGTRWLGAAVVAGVLLVAVTATAQLLLAHHHPSDLLGGWLWAGAWTAAVWAAGSSRPQRARG